MGSDDFGALLRAKAAYAASKATALNELIRVSLDFCIVIYFKATTCVNHASF